MAKPKQKAVDSLSYEEAYTELAGIVDKLETGSLPLEQSLMLFERGQELSRRCGILLEEAELKLRVLTEDLNGELHESDLKLEDE